MTRYVLERRVLALLTAVFLASWLLPCVTDVNHPPGTRLVRVAAAGAALGMLWLEAARPWWGFYSFLLLWPHMLVIRELLSRQSELWQHVPLFGGGPLAAALALGYWLRLERARRGANVSPAPKAEPPPDSSKWVLAFRVGLWVLVASWLLSLLVCLVRLRAWEALPLAGRLLLSQSPLSPLMPAVATVSLLPSLLLALLLLNGLSDPALDRCPAAAARPTTTGTFVTFLCLSGLLIAAQVLLQIITGWAWAFDSAPPAGPFVNRNTAAPVLVILGIFFFALARLHAGPKKVVAVGLGVAVLVCSCLTASRNALFLVALTPMLVLLSRATWHRAALAGLVCLALCVTVYVLPLPRKDGSHSEPVQRASATLEALRKGDWEHLLAGRLDLFESALRVSSRYPLMGSGPATFAMVTRPKPRLRVGGVRGEFTITRCKDEKGYYIEARLAHAPADEAPVLQLQYDLDSQALTKRTLEVTAEARRSKGAAAQFFYQDRTNDGWCRLATPLAGQDWETIAWRGTVREGALAASVGFYFEPKSKDEWLQIRSLSLVSDDFSDWLGPDRISAGRLAATAGLSEVYLAAHSMPLNLLAEIGPLGALAWLALWVVLPMLALIRWRAGNVTALAVLLAGAGNLFDTAWLGTGVTTFFVLLLVLACWECRNAYAR
ncbi:MAG: hypothetical protein NTW87_23960 [Planctomycetota bacterium]|nr:hypothetical protein [Planctomycetota bacterium]